MFIFLILVRATALVIAGYFVWFAASRSEERLRSVGKYLALWTFVIAGLYVIGSIAVHSVGAGRFAARRAMGPVAMRMHHPGIAMRRGMPRFRFPPERRLPADQNTQGPQPAQPAQPAPSQPGK